MFRRILCCHCSQSHPIECCFRKTNPGKRSCPHDRKFENNHCSCLPVLYTCWSRLVSRKKSSQQQLWLRVAEVSSFLRNQVVVNGKLEDKLCRYSDGDNKKAEPKSRFQKNLLTTRINTHPFRHRAFQLLHPFPSFRACRR